MTRWHALHAYSEAVVIRTTLYKAESEPACVSVSVCVCVCAIIASPEEENLCRNVALPAPCRAFDHFIILKHRKLYYTSFAKHQLKGASPLKLGAVREGRPFSNK